MQTDHGVYRPSSMTGGYLILLMTGFKVFIARRVSSKSHLKLWMRKVMFVTVGTLEKVLTCNCNLCVEFTRIVLG